MKRITPPAVPRMKAECKAMIEAIDRLFETVRKVRAAEHGRTLH